ncbi:MAG: alanine racemase, partial [Armatimonadetes bacterium]|nr:alanine racemase [Candidatus Hippobium faecium]
MLLGTQKINSQGHLEIGGCDTTELAKEYGTPLYVMDEALIRDNCSKYVNSIKANYPDADIAYASKAFIVIQMCKLAQEEGLWLDVASAGELYTAKLAGADTHKILFHGNFKSDLELEMAVDEEVFAVVCDSFSEIKKLNAIAGSKGKIQNVFIRCNPGVDPHTHSMISTGQEDSKFGFNIKNGDAIKAINNIMDSSNLNLIGLHSHLGSQLLEENPFEECAPIMADFFDKVIKETGADLKVLDLGGGLGVRYLEEHNPKPIEEFTKMIAENVKKAFSAKGLKLPKLILEP